jgi:hypothetical protein
MSSNLWAFWTSFEIAAKDDLFNVHWFICNLHADLSINLRIISKRILAKKGMRMRTGLGSGPVGSGEYGNGHSGSITDEEFLDKLNDC